MADIFGRYGIPASLWPATLPPYIAGRPMTLPGGRFTIPNPINPPIVGNAAGLRPSYPESQPYFGTTQPGFSNSPTGFAPTQPMEPKPPKPPDPSSGSLSEYLKAKREHEEALKRYRDVMGTPGVDEPDVPSGMPSRKVIPWLAIGSVIAQALAGPHSNVGSSILGGFLQGERAKQEGEYQQKKVEAERKRRLLEEQQRLAGLDVETSRERVGMTRDEEDREQARRDRKKAQDDYEDAQAKELKWKLLIRDAEDPKLSVDERKKAAEEVYYEDTERFGRFGPLYWEALDAEAQVNAAGKAPKQPNWKSSAEAIHDTRMEVVGSGVSDRRGAQMAPVLARYAPESIAQIVADEASAQHLLAAKQNGWRNSTAETRLEWERLHDKFASGQTGYSAIRRGLKKEAAVLERKLASASNQVAEAKAHPDRFSPEEVSALEKERDDYGAQLRYIVGLPPGVKNMFMALGIPVRATGLLEQVDALTAGWKQILAASQPPLTVLKGNGGSGRSASSVQGPSRARR